MRELAAVLAAIVVGALIIVKFDKQVTHLLEGGLHRAGRDVAKARIVYREKAGRVSLILSVLGMGVLAFAITAWVRDATSLAITAGAGGRYFQAQGFGAVLGVIWPPERN